MSELTKGGPIWAAHWEAYETELQALIDKRVAHAHLERATWMAERTNGVLVDHSASSEGEQGMKVVYNRGRDYNEDGSKTFGGRMRVERRIASAVPAQESTKAERAAEKSRARRVTKKNNRKLRILTAARGVAMQGKLPY